MPYADFAHYTGVYLGNAITEDAFPRLALRASERVDALTRYGARAAYDTDPAPIASAVCAIAEVLQQAERGNMLADTEGATRYIQTETAGKYHVTYYPTINTASIEGQAAIDRAIYKAAVMYLQPTGLLYQGVGMR